MVLIFTKGFHTNCICDITVNDKSSGHYISVGPYGWIVLLANTLEINDVTFLELQTRADSVFDNISVIRHTLTSLRRVDSGWSVVLECAQ